MCDDEKKAKQKIDEIVNDAIEKSITDPVSNEERQQFWGDGAKKVFDGTLVNLMPYDGVKSVCIDPKGETSTLNTQKTTKTIDPLPEE